MQQIEPTEDVSQASPNPPSEKLVGEGLEPGFPARPSSSQVPRTGRVRMGLFAIFAPTKSSDETERRRSILMLMMLAVILFLAASLIVSGLLGLNRNGDIQGALCGVVGVGLAFGLVFLKRIKSASYVFLTGVIIALLLRSLDIGLHLANLAFNYFAVAACIAFAGLIIDQFAPFIVATVGVVSFSLVFWYYGANNQGDTSLLLQALAYGAGLHYIMALMSWSNARTIRRAMRLMTWQNEALMLTNRQLESNLQRDLAMGDTVSQLSSDLSQISYDQSQRAQGQAHSVAVVTSTLEELGATARQIAEVAENVAQATEQALQTAESGGRSVGLSIDSIGVLISQVEGINTITSELGIQSKRISEIVETITDLAEETNLLALNATIEAAGAGEYGRRFAVVAAEVQTLANRSRTASREVEHILGQIRTSIESTLRATEGGLEEARRMNEISSQAGEAIEQIIETVEGTTYLARQINLTTQQQRSATDQAVEMIRRVAGDSREGAARAQQLLFVSDRMSQTASSLRQSGSHEDEKAPVGGELGSGI